jgi:polyvinyl alcohol dehydrogenase (cytochrome)
MKLGRRALRATATAGALSLMIILTAPAQGAGQANWPAYLFGNEHSSFNAAATAITPANAASLKVYWKWKPAPPTMVGQPSAGLFASPVVVNGRVYIGANTGWFYALDLATKTVVWSKFIGFVAHHTCGKRGITSTATVVPDPSRAGQLTVYVAGGDGYLYALRASDGATVWQSVVGQLPSPTKNDYYNWSSPAVLNGRVYMGLTSQCDNPLIRGGVVGYSQASGASLGTYFAMAPTHVGGGVWSSPAVNAQDQVFVTTGTGRVDDAEAIVRIDGPSMTRQEAWQVPTSEAIADSDFGASPTLFSATIQGVPTPMVGACNKNGIFYALRQTGFAPGPVWRFQAADPSRFGETACLAAGVWDGSRLFVAGSPTTVGGVHFQGAIRRLDPATGLPIWERGLSGVILGTPTLDGAGVIAAGTYDADGTNSLYLLDASNGNLLKEFPMAGAHIFAQPVFADSYLLVARTGGPGLIVYTP